jgi:hypothetical protein
VLTTAPSWRRSSFQASGQKLDLRYLAITLEPRVGRSGSEGGVGRSAAYYQGIRGSSSLATSRLDPAAVPAEALQPGELRRLPFGGELLGAVRVRGAFATLPLDAFDRLGELLEAEEQGAYLQLLRLAWGEGQNYCRAGKRELMGRQ